MRIIFEKMSSSTYKIDKKIKLFFNGYDADNRYYLIIEDKVVGAVDMYCKYKYNRFVKLFSLEIFDIYRGKGFGKILLQEVEKWCYHNNFTNIILSAYNTNKVALNLYSKYGFTILSENDVETNMNKKVNYFFKFTIDKKEIDIDNYKLLHNSNQKYRFCIVDSFKDDIVGLSIETTNCPAIRIWSLYTNDNFRHKGYAKKLLLELEKIVKYNFNAIDLFVERNNPVAINLYKKMGYEGDETPNGYYYFNMNKTLKYEN